MRVKRLLLACVISLGVSLQGFAGVIAIEVPCPMMHAEAGSDLDAPMHEESSDCCGDADTFAKAGKMCSMGSACHVEGQALQTVIALVTIAPLGIFDTPLVNPDPGSWDPSYVWRPPALI